MSQQIPPKLTSWLSAKQVIIEIVLAALVAFAGILKILHLPGADEMLMISMLTLASFYFLIGFFFTGETTAISLHTYLPLQVRFVLSDYCSPFFIYRGHVNN